MQKFKKAISVFLTIVMLLSITSVGFTTFAASDWDNIECTPLVLGLDVDVSLTLDEKAYFSFTPDVSGVYCFSSRSLEYCDNCVDLYQASSDSDPIHLKYEDYGGENGNFGLYYPLVAGETYYYVVRMYDAYIGDVFGNFTVVINKSPIENISFEPITLIENANGYWNSTPNGEEYFHYRWWESLKYTITMDDGEVIERTGSGFNYNDKWYYFDFSDNQNSNPWKVGNTYTETVKVMGFEADVNVTIAESPIESMVFEPINFIENTGGSWGTDGNGEEYYYYAWYDHLKYTITMNNGEVIEGAGSGFNYNDQWYSFYYSRDNQSSNPWQVGNTYTKTIGVMGFEADVDINIIESPIESIAFEPITLIENTNGYWTSTPDGEEYFYYHWHGSPKYTITMNDGEVIEGTGIATGFYYNDEWYYFHYSDNQSSNPWQLGNTYTETVKVMGFEAEVDVTIAESPIESAVFEPVTLIENTNGYWGSTPDGEEYFYYHWNNSLKYTITMNDGEVIEGTGSGFSYNDRWYSFNTSDTQYSNPWKVGNTYTATVNVMGFEAEVDVTITKSPIESVVFEPITLIENTNGSLSSTPDGKEYFNYWWHNSLEYTITMNNGEVIKETGSGFHYNDEWYYFSYSDGQYQNHWKAGNTYTVTVNVMGFEAEVDVTITKSPVESAVFEPVTLIENTNGYWNSTPDGKQYFYYWWTNSLEYTVTMKDGEVIKGTGGGFSYNGVQYSFNTFENQYENPFMPGNNYTIEISVLGCVSQVELSVSQKNETDGFEYLVEDGNAIIIGTNRLDSVLVIPSTLDGYTVVGITDLTEAMQYAQEIVIPDTVTMYSNNIFMNGYQLEKITLGKHFTKLTNETFSGCSNLKEIIISPENTEYTSVDGVVYDKDVTTVIIFPHGKTGTYTVPDTVTDISVVFDNMGYYDIELDLGNSNTGYLEVDGVYYNKDMTTVYMCSPNKTGSYTMPNTVTEISEYAFQGTNLSEIIVSENVSDIVYNAFSYSIELEKVVLPQNLKSISEFAFYNCTGLTDVTLPSSLVELEDYAFSGSGIKRADIPSGVEVVGVCAYSGSQLSELTLAEGIRSISSCAFESTFVKEVVLPDSLIHLGTSAFRKTLLQSLKIGSGLENIAACAFADTNLTSVTIPENVVEIGAYAFENSPLKEAKIEYNAIYISEGAFYNCPLEEIELKEGTICIEDYAFYGNNTESLVLPQSVTDITYKSFAESKKLLNIDVSDELNSLCGNAFDGTAWWDAQADGVVYLEKYLYGYKGKMPVGTDITVNDGTPIIADYAFDNESNLKSLYIPASVKTIGHGALNACFSLEKVIVDPANTYYSTNEDGTILYDSKGNAIWKKIESINSVWRLRDYFSYGEDFLGSEYDNIALVGVDYVDGSEDSLTYLIKDGDFSGFDSTKFGYQIVTLKFGNFSYEYEVYVEEPDIVDLKLEKLPNKIQYDLNQSFRTAGMVVKAICSNGNEIEITDYEISGYDPSTIGVQNITVSFRNFALDFEVEVKGENITYVDENQNDETKVEISAPQDTFDEGTKLVVDVLISDDVEDVEVPEEFESDNSVIFDIYFEKEEEVVQPKTTVTVSIPVPYGFDGRNCKIFHITDGQSVDMLAEFVDGYLVFTTTHFSYYAIRQMEGYAVSGNITTFGDVNDETTVTLSKEGTVYQTTTTVNGTYNFSGVSEGTYTVTFEKENHVTRTYEITVTDTSVVLDAKIHLLGDIDGNGRINVSDVGKANAHAKKTKFLEGYEFVCADINGDGTINISDVGKINAHAKKTLPLW